MIEEIKFNNNEEEVKKFLDDRGKKVVFLAYEDGNKFLRILNGTNHSNYYFVYYDEGETIKIIDGNAVK